METIVSLKNVVKEYTTGEKTFTALDHVLRTCMRVGKMRSGPLQPSCLSIVV